MKTKIFATLITVAVLSGIVGFNIPSQESKLKIITLTNVEALSRWEFPSSWDDMWTVTYYDGWHHCESEGPDTCPGI